jgi:hypothetical protein
MWLRILERFGASGEASFERHGDRSRLRLLACECDHGPAAAPDEGLADALERVRIVATEGRFVHASGVTLMPDGRPAILDSSTAHPAGDCPIDVVLEWR